MYNKEHILNGKKFVFEFTHEPYYIDENTIVMGFPFDMDCPNFSEVDVNNVKGYYIHINLNEKGVRIINDIMGDYRTYYMEKDGITYFSNDFLILYNKLDVTERIANKFEVEYWKKHRYTTGAETFVKKIHKIKPAQIYNFTSEGVQEKLYFQDNKNKPNRQKHFEEVLADLRDTISKVKKMPQKKFLLFSGGADSTLIVHMLQEQNVDFIPIFARVEPTNTMNYEDILKVKYSADKLGINVKEVVINQKDIHLPQELVNTLFTDRCTAEMFYGIMAKISEEYGRDVVVLSGESADSIFNFGPTGYDSSSYFSRHLLLSKNIIYKNILLWILKLKNYNFYKNFRLPHNNKEFLMAFFDEFGYRPLIEITKGKEYYNHISEYIFGIKNSIKNFYSIMMYLKMFVFLQASDNFCQVQLPEFYGTKLIFVFGTPEIVYSTLRNTDFSYELGHPKSIVYKILEDVFSYKMPNIKKEKNFSQNMKNSTLYLKYTAKLHEKYYEKFESLGLIKDEK